MAQKKYGAIAIAAVVVIAAGVVWYGLVTRPIVRHDAVQLSDSVVAVIGGSYVTRAELLNAYETAYPSIKAGVTDKERLYSVLAGMLAEKLLADDARSQGYESDGRIAQLNTEFQRMYLIEHVITSDVDSKIVVSDDEARDETMKSLVTFKFRYWVEPTLDRAAGVRAAMQKNGFEKTVAAIVRRNPEVKRIASDLESEYMRWNEIDPKFFGALKDLPVGGVSVPVEHDGAFYLLKMEDIRRSGMTTGQLASSLPSSKKVLFARKRMAARKSYVAAMMEPKQVKTHARTLRVLMDAVAEWHASPSLARVDFFTAASMASAATPHLRRYAEERSQSLVTTTDRTYSIDEIAHLLPLRKIMTEFRQPVVGFAAYTGAAVRDEYLKHRGEERGYAADPEVKDRLRMWNDKWLYEEYRKRSVLGGASSVAADTARTGPNVLHRIDMKRLVHRVDSLAHINPLHINTAVIDTMHVAEPLKSRGMFVSIVRGGTDTPPLPLVGNEWKEEIQQLKAILGLHENKRNSNQSH